MNILLPKTGYLLFFLLSLGLFLSLYKLGDLPYSVHGDEGETALAALDILKGKTGIFGVGWYDVPLSAFAPHAVTMAVFGENTFGNRLGSVIFAIATIPLFYLLVEMLFTRRVALIATILLATSHMWIALSRLGLPYVQTTFFVVSTVYLLIGGMKTGQKKFFVLGGIFLGLCFYSYYPARIIPFLLLPYVFVYFLKAKNRKKALVHMAIFLASAVITFIPQGKYFLEHPETFSRRADTVFIFSESGRQWTNYNKSDVQVLFEQTKKTINIFTGDNSTQYGYKGQLIDCITVALFFAGMLYALRFFSSKSLLLFVWLVLALLGQILTTMPTPIFLPRFVVGLPVFFIFCALGFDVLYKATKRYNLKHILVLPMLLIIFYNLHIYFIDYPKQLERGIAGGGFHELTPVKIAKYLDTLPNGYKAIFLTPPYLNGDYGTLKFLISQKERITIDSPQTFVADQENKAVLGAQIENLNNSEGLVFIIYPEYQSELRTLTKVYPHGQVSEFHNGDGQLEVILYTVKSP